MKFMAKKYRSSGKINTLTACISTTMVLILLGTVTFFTTMADNLGRTTKESFSVQVLVSDSITPGQLDTMKRFMRSQKPVRELAFISKEEATKEMAAMDGFDSEEFLGYSPYPASFELQLKADYVNNDSLGKYIPAISQYPNVTEVIYSKDVVNGVDHVINTISSILLAIAVLLGIVSYALIRCTIYFSVYANRYTIYTMKLIGAKWSFIRRPYIMHAFGIGLVSSLLADGALLFGIHTLQRWDESITPLLTTDVLICTFSIVPLVGICLSVLCAFFCINHFLRLRGNKIYFQ